MAKAIIGTTNFRSYVEWVGQDSIGVFSIGAFFKRFQENESVFGFSF